MYHLCWKMTQNSIDNCIYSICRPYIEILSYGYIGQGTNCETIKFAWWPHQMKHFPRSWPFVRGIHRLPVNSPHKGQWRGALVFSLICAWTNAWVNNREAGDLRRHCAHYDVIAMDLNFYFQETDKTLLNKCPSKFYPEKQISMNKRSI